MAIKPCKECGAPVSDKAVSCPSCGAKVVKSVSPVMAVLIVLAGAALLFQCVGSSNNETSTQSSNGVVTKEKLCTLVKSISNEAMTARQNGVPLIQVTEASKSITDEGARLQVLRYVALAYSVPIENGEIGKKKQVTNFENTAYKACMDKAKI